MGEYAVATGTDTFRCEISAYPGSHWGIWCSRLYLRGSAYRLLFFLWQSLLLRPLRCRLMRYCMILALVFLEIARVGCCSLDLSEQVLQGHVFPLHCGLGLQHIPQSLKLRIEDHCCHYFCTHHRLW